MILIMNIGRICIGRSHILRSAEPLFFHRTCLLFCIYCRKNNYQRREDMVVILIFNICDPSGSSKAEIFSLPLLH